MPPSLPNSLTIVGFAYRPVILPGPASSISGLLAEFTSDIVHCPY